MNVYLKTALIVIIGLGSTMVFSKFIEKGHSKYHAHILPKTREIFSAKTAYDGIYLGSSRAHTTIRPSVVDSVTGLSSYNCGNDAANFYEIKMILDGFLANHPNPRYVVLAMDPFSFHFDRTVYYPIQYFGVIQNPAVRSAFKELKDYKYLLIRNFRFLRMIYYSDYIKSQAIRGLMGADEFTTFGGKQSIEDRGFVSLGNNCMDTLEKHPAKTSIIDKEGLDKLQGIIDTCKARNIRLILTYAPEYNYTFQSTFTGFDRFIRTVDSVASKNSLPFYRDDSLPLCKNPCLFANFNHLNAQGALEYSRILGQRISWILQNKK
jgi:hypothetical protein